MDLMVNHSWPGNVRELENALQRAVLLAKGSAIQEWNLPIHGRQAEVHPDLRLDDSRSLSEKVESLVSHVEKSLITEALEKAKGKRDAAAQILGLSLKTLYNKMKKHDLLSE